MLRPDLKIAALLIAFAPAEAARGGEFRGVPALEIVTFRLVEGADRAAFIEAAKGTEAMLRARGTLIRRNLSVDNNGTWQDVIEWTSMTAALETAEAVMADPAFAPFGAMIDPETVDMRHATIAWQME